MKRLTAKKKSQEFKFKLINNSLDLFSEKKIIELVFAISSDEEIPPLKLFFNKTQLQVSQQKLEKSVFSRIFGSVPFAALIKVSLPQDLRFQTKQVVHFFDAIDLEKIHSTTLSQMYDFFDESPVFIYDENAYLSLNKKLFSEVSSIEIIVDGITESCSVEKVNANEYLRFDYSKIKYKQLKSCVLRLTSTTRSSYVDFDVSKKFVQAQVTKEPVKKDNVQLSSNPTILVMKLDHIGDFMLSGDAFKSLREKFPTAQIDLICGSWNKALAESMGIFNTIFCYDFFSKKSGDWKGLSLGETSFHMYEMSKLIVDVYDLAIDYRVDSDTRFLLKGIRAKSKIGFSAPGAFNFLKRSIDVSDSYPSLRKGSEILDHKKSNFYPGFLCADSSIILTPKSGVVSICLTSDYLNSQNNVEGSGDGRLMSFALESAQIIHREGQDIVISDSCDVKSCHSKDFHHDIEGWGYWCHSKVAPYILKFSSIAHNKNSELLLKIRMPFFKGESALKKRVSIFSFGNEYALEFTSDAATKTIAIPISLKSYNSSYYFSVKSMELPLINLTKMSYSDSVVNHRFFAFNKYGVIGKFNSILSEQQMVDYNDCISLTDVVLRNQVYVMGAIESSKSDSLIRLSAASKINPKKIDVAPLQHRSVAFNMLTDLAVSELNFKNQIALKINRGIKNANQSDFVIGICLGANSNARKWPIDHFISLIQKLIQYDKVFVNIYGAGSEDEKDSELVRLACRSSKIRNFVNKFNLDETMAHIQEVDLYVGNNSGLGHLAAYVNVPSLIIFSGANESDRWSPKSNTDLIIKNVSCSPCDISLRSACPNNMKCLDGITPSEVFDRISHVSLDYFKPLALKGY